jgi:tetratricopeptide (TPR) repeat protein
MRRIRAIVRIGVLALGVALAYVSVAHGQVKSSVLADSAARISEKGAAENQKGTREGRELAIRYFMDAAALYLQGGGRSDAADLYANVAFLHNALGRRDSALVYYRRALPEIADSASLAVATRQYGEVFHVLGRLDSAAVQYDIALRVARSIGDRRAEGSVLSNIGSVHSAQSRPDSASIYFHSALLIRREVKDVVGEGTTLNNLAILHQNIGRPDSSIVYLQQSLDARRRAKNLAGEGTTLNNIGRAFELLLQYDSAAYYYRAALPVLERAGNRTTFGLAHANVGRVFLALHQPDSAQKYLHEGLRIAREVRDQPGSTWALNDLGRMHAQLTQRDSAQHYFAQALASLREIGDRAREGNTLYEIGRFHHRTAPAQLARAVAYYDSAAALRATVGRRTLNDANRVAFIEQDVRMFSEWSLAWLARASELNKEAAAAGALAAAERGRAQALLDLLRTSSARDSSSARIAPAIGADLVAEGRRLATSAARHGAATLQYLVTEDSLIVWLIDARARIRASVLPVGRDSLAKLVRAWREGTGAQGGARALLSADASPDRGIGVGRASGTAEAAAAALGNILLPAALRGGLPTTGKVVIIPHGPLTLVPFAALPVGARSFLGLRNALSYAPSLATLAEVEQRSPARAMPRTFTDALVIGNPTMPDVPQPTGGLLRLDPLPGAEREARWVANRLGVTALTGAAASESSVLDRLRTAQVAHLATHGFAYSSDARARDSFVALAAGNGENGLLTVAEVLEQAPSLQAELVVLSACQTGLGDLKESEGTIGLQRAFLARGARSVLVSLWNVSDAATEELMKAFYLHWLEDKDQPSKSEALRRAQNDVRRMKGFEHPRFWAAFQLVGAN